jgi:acetyl esterase/lipase
MEETMKTAFVILGLRQLDIRSVPRSGVRAQWRSTKIVILLLLTVFTIVRLNAQTYTTRDTIYTPPGYEDGPLTATLVIPKTPNGVGVVLAHYLGATRQSLAVWCDTLAVHGYVAMTIDYYDFRSGPNGVYPKPIRAFKIAIEFLRRNAASLGITSGRIVGFGQSEGATHWGETIIWDNDDAYFQTDPTINDSLNAVILLYGLYDNNRYLQSQIDVNGLLTSFFAPDTAWRSTKGNCIAHTRNITTPVLLLQGVNDGIVQYQQSVELHDSLISRSKKCELVLDSDLDVTWGHAFDNLSSPPYSFTPNGLIAKDIVLGYLQRTFYGPAGSVLETSNSSEFRLDQNYPNPFNPSTTIRFGIPHRSHVTMIVYSMLGQTVATLVEGNMESGYHEVKFDGSRLSSGVYFYKIQAGDFFQAKRLILLK